MNREIGKQTYHGDTEGTEKSRFAADLRRWALIFIGPTPSYDMSSGPDLRGELLLRR